MLQKRDRLFLWFLKKRELTKKQKNKFKKQNLSSQTKNVKQFHSETPKLKINNYRRVN